MMIFSEGLETHGESTRYIELGGTGDGVILRLWLALQEGDPPGWFTCEQVHSHVRIGSRKWKQADDR